MTMTLRHMTLRHVGLDRLGSCRTHLAQHSAPALPYAYPARQDHDATNGDHLLPPVPSAVEHPCYLPDSRAHSLHMLAVYFPRLPARSIGHFSA